MNQEEFNARVKKFLEATVSDPNSTPLMFEEASTLIEALEFIESE